MTTDFPIGHSFDGGRFLVVGTFGAGSQGTVLKVSDAKDGGHRALKIIMKTPAGWINSQNELRSLYHLQGIDGIPRLVSMFQSPTYVAIVTPVNICDLSKLRKQNPKRRFEKKTNITLFYQMLTTLQCMHSQDFVHRDIKGANIMLKSNHLDYYHPIELIDHGMSLHTTIDRPTPKDPTYIGCKYATPSMHNGEWATAKDDLLMLIYFILECYDETIFGVRTGADIDEIMKQKTEFERNPGMFSDECWIHTVVNEVSNKRNDEEPEYVKIRGIVKHAKRLFNPVNHKLKLKENENGEKYLV